MDREKTILAVLIGILICLGGNIGLTLNEKTRLTHQVTVVCKEHTLLAKIAAEEIGEERLSARLLPRVSINGLTAKELAELSLRKAERKERAYKALDTIRRATC